MATRSRNEAVRQIERWMRATFACVWRYRESGFWAASSWSSSWIRSSRRWAERVNPNRPASATSRS